MLKETGLDVTYSKPVRSVNAVVAYWDSSNNKSYFHSNTNLKSLKIERVGEEGKFFGFGISHKANIKVLDIDRTNTIKAGERVRISIGYNASYPSGAVFITPTLYVSEVHRDENTNELSITAYDCVINAKDSIVEYLHLQPPYTLKDVAKKCGTWLGRHNLYIKVGDTYVTETDEAFLTSFEDGANLEGTETIKEVLDAIAEATQTIYYSDNGDNLVFKRLDRDGDPLYTIDKSQYFTMESGDNRRLGTITHTTDLGDNVSASTTQTGTTQYIRDNPFLDLREDVGTLIDESLARIGGITINQFNCKWRGSRRLEVGDKIALITKDDETVISYLLDDVITYDGTYSHKTQWKYSTNNEETETNSTNLGDVLKQTYAKVDKANKEIAIVAGRTEENAAAIAGIHLDTASISLSVESMRKETEDALKEQNDNITDISKKVEAAITDEELNISIQEVINNGVSQVTTSTGFKFDDEGLTVSKTDSEISTQITEDGMQVFKNNEAVLTANNVGVDARNLHATTYLIIGTNSRFENYGDNRTGCFWIGG